MRLAGKPPGPAWDKIAGVYRTGDGRNVRLHTNFPHHRDGMLKLLGCAYEREAVQAALAQVGGREIRDGGRRSQARRHHDALARRMGGAPQGQAVAQLPLLEITRIGEAPARALPPAGRAAAVGHPRARPHARHRRPGVRPHARRARRRRHAHHGAASAGLAAARHRHRPRQALGRARPARRGGARAAARPAARGARVRAGLSAGRDRRRSASRPRPAPRSGPASSPSRCRPTATRARGPSRRGFDSLVQNASGINHAEAEAAGIAAGPRSCPPRRSTTPPAT